MGGKRSIPIMKLLILGLCGLALVAVIRWFWPVPGLKDGDIIFQTSQSGQSNAIMLATHSFYSHMGILKHTNKGWVVIEAVGPVKETPLKRWTKRGLQDRVAIYRHSGLTKMQADKLFSAASQLYGRKYDSHFSFDNDQIYCSELVYLAFKAAGVDLGRKQSIGSLGTDLGFAKSLLNRRILSDPECRAKALRGDTCLRHVRQRLLVTPKSIAQDKTLTKVYSNYPI